MSSKFRIIIEGECSDDRFDEYFDDLSTVPDKDVKITKFKSDEIMEE